MAQRPHSEAGMSPGDRPDPPEDREEAPHGSPPEARQLTDIPQDTFVELSIDGGKSWSRVFVPGQPIRPWYPDRMPPCLLFTDDEYSLQRPSQRGFIYADELGNSKRVRPVSEDISPPEEQS